jgi:hypothetical protein
MPCVLSCTGCVIVELSGSVNTSMEALLLGRGADAFVPKSGRRDDLVTAIRQLCSQRRPSLTPRQTVVPVWVCGQSGLFTQGGLDLPGHNGRDVGGIGQMLQSAKDPPRKGKAHGHHGVPPAFPGRHQTTHEHLLSSMAFRGMLTTRASCPCRSGVPMPEAHPNLLTTKRPCPEGPLAGLIGQTIRGSPPSRSPRAPRSG